VATEEEVDAACRRLQSSRTEILQLVRVIKGDKHERDQHEPSATDAPVYRSHIMRALTGQPAKTLGRAALALAMSRPRALWKLTTLLPVLRPILSQYLSQRLSRPRRKVSAF
jgi:hypothetical protein